MASALARRSRTTTTAATANAPDVGRGHDRQPAVPVEVGQEAVGAVGQAVEVECAGEDEVDRRR